uniref:Putative molecular chaperone prefoldin subunit 1 n=1 Tax=Panstrongylus lignarius TaxID=156445 RepID=A0A224XWR3_9HEMI
MSMTVDVELKKAFTELQQKMLETTQKVKLADIQIESLKRSRQRADLTTLEIKALQENTMTYESLGRMFIRTPIPIVLENLNTRSVSCAEQIKSLENNKAFLEKSMKESENNLREMVQQRKEKQEK